MRKPQDIMLGDGHSLSATEANNVTLELVLGNGKTKWSNYIMYSIRACVGKWQD